MTHKGQRTQGRDDMQGGLLEGYCRGSNMALWRFICFFVFFPPHSKMLLGNQGRPNWQNLWEMGRKTKIKGSRVWRFISSPTIKEVCTTPMLYLTKTEREKRRKIVLALIGATVFFPTSLFFLKWRLGKNVYQEEWQKHKKRTPPIDREAKRVRIHNGENKRTRDRGRRKKRAW